MAMRLVRPGTATDGESVSNDDVPRRADGGEGVLEGDNGVGRGKEVVLRVARGVEDGAGGPGYEGERGDGIYLDGAEGGHIPIAWMQKGMMGMREGEGREMV